MENTKQKILTKHACENFETRCGEDRETKRRSRSEWLWRSWPKTHEREPHSSFTTKSCDLSFNISTKVGYEVIQEKREMKYVACEFLYKFAVENKKKYYNLKITHMFCKICFAKRNCFQEQKTQKRLAKTNAHDVGPTIFCF